MSKAVTLAAAYMGHGAGWRGQDTDMLEFVTNYMPVLTSYAEVAVELVDAAKMITMFDEPVFMEVYEMFGDDFVENFAEGGNNECPSEEWCHEHLHQLVYNFYEGECNDQQKAALKRALDAVIEAY